MPRRLGDSPFSEVLDVGVGCWVRGWRRGGPLPLALTTYPPHHWNDQEGSQSHTGGWGQRDCEKEDGVGEEEDSLHHSLELKGCPRLVPGSEWLSWIGCRLQEPHIGGGWGTGSGLIGPCECRYLQIDKTLYLKGSSSGKTIHAYCRTA